MTNMNEKKTCQAKIVGLEGVHEVIFVKEYQNVAIVECLDTKELAVARLCDFVAPNKNEVKETRQ
ncbi:hypothetical protein [Enterococcus canintestini]|uniref:hypothetical protein n=1 Tax=Enterococcus canintestini TaxID=317010 RepID=UPI00288D5B9C|nr:hypothetical protein [Enterococcus canintestini]MDT2739187.1 hypothetical protein [Enterococcus canintestini]